MVKQIKIKDIAQLAGVSAGTVDRVLHNRGNVSAKTRARVECVLREVDYKMNIRASAISFRKEFTIVIAIPTFSPGEYWGSIRNGIEAALQEYADISIRCIWFPYNQYDVYSCRSTFESVANLAPDAVIMGPIFECETLSFCNQLDTKAIPYFFVDSVIAGTNPWASFTTDQFACGRLMAHLMESILPADAEVVIMSAQRIGSERAHNSIEREKGFRDFFESVGKADRVHKEYFSPLNPEKSSERNKSFLLEHPKVKGIAVMNSRGHIMAELLKENRFKDIRLICYDMTGANIRCLQEGLISFLLCQNPERQGFNAVKSLIKCLLYRQPEEEPHQLMPIDILVKENLPFYDK